jgi:hypothetical protein
MSLQEGWYLMSTPELEHELARWRHPEADLRPSGARRLSVPDALAYRNAGNVPDAQGRTLRLVLTVDRRAGAPSLDARRQLYEPDFHEVPTWRRSGSVPVNIVPLRLPESPPAADRAWFEEPELAALEEEWRATGALAGLRVPAGLRGFVYKTVLSLRASGREVTVEAVASSLARWVRPEEARRIRRALQEANPDAPVSGAPG